MLLRVKEKFDGRPTNFITKIEDGIKLHALLRGNWQSATEITFTTGGGAKYIKHFQRPCTAIQKVKLVLPITGDLRYVADMNIYVDDKHLNPLENNYFVKNEGFEHGLEFLRWFFFKKIKGEWKQVETSWEGYIIHWTKLLY